MSEWWMYRLSDLLMFSPATYWRLIELFGITPEPTALVSLGLLLASAQPLSRTRRCLLAIIPTLSLLVGAATLWAMADRPI